MARKLFDCRCREVRKSLGLTLAEVSGATGVGINDLSRMERGGGVRLLTAMRVAAFYRMKVEELWQIREGD